MAIDGFSSTQNLKRWGEMLHGIYGPTQNYSKSSFEVLSHLTEVSNMMSKFLVRKRDIVKAQLFLPKMFAWGFALLELVNRQDTDLERIILEKFPGVCAYCARKPCTCWSGEKPTPDVERHRQLFYENAKTQKRSVSDFLLMFSEIYGHTWPTIDAAYLRLTEELAELCEAVRIYHIYPKNFENELADFFAWWFALANLIEAERTQGAVGTELLLWNSYPGRCSDCASMPCFCPPGPMRELMSKPAPGQAGRQDALTSLNNQGAYNADLVDIRVGRLAIPGPFVCVRIDVDKFKDVNDTYGHSAGDEALRHIASVIRKKIRLQDRAYRVSGDEFGLILSDLSEEEGFGLMKRTLAALQETAVKWVSPEGKVSEFRVTASIGVAECNDTAKVNESFEFADKAAYSSKSKGRNQVTRASVI